MTQDELDAEIGRAHRERREIVQKLNCLRDRVRRVVQAAQALLIDPEHADSWPVIDWASDIREDLAEIRRCTVRLRELDAILS